jgi:hypothetical protein
MVSVCGLWLAFRDGVTVGDHLLCRGPGGCARKVVARGRGDDAGDRDGVIAEGGRDAPLTRTPVGPRAHVVPAPADLTRWSASQSVFLGSGAGGISCVRRASAAFMGISGFACQVHAAEEVPAAGRDRSERSVRPVRPGPAARRPAGRRPPSPALCLHRKRSFVLVRHPRHGVEILFELCERSRHASVCRHDRADTRSSEDAAVGKPLGALERSGLYEADQRGARGGAGAGRGGGRSRRRPDRLHRPGTARRAVGNRSGRPHDTGARRARRTLFCFLDVRQELSP